MKHLLLLSLILFLHQTSFAVIDLTKLKVIKAASTKTSTPQEQRQRRSQYRKALSEGKICTWDNTLASGAQYYTTTDIKNCETGKTDQLIQGTVVCTMDSSILYFPEVSCFNRTSARDCLISDEVTTQKIFEPRALPQSPLKQERQDRGLRG